MSTDNPKDQPNDRKQPSVHDEIRRQFDSALVHRRGSSQQRRRYRQIEPIDELFGEDGKEANDGEVRKRDKAGKED
jgi:hypothetical protein